MPAYVVPSGYIDEVSLALQFVRDSQEATIEEKKRFFKSANKVGPFDPTVRRAMIDLPPLTIRLA